MNLIVRLRDTCSKTILWVEEPYLSSLSVSFFFSGFSGFIMSLAMCVHWICVLIWIYLTCD